MRAFPNNTHDGVEWGMDLRDYFAAAALQGILANPETGENTFAITLAAYEFADSMIKQRED